MDAVVDFGQCALETPFQRCRPRLFILESLELLDEVELELGAEPGAELEGNVAVGKGATVPAGFGVQADGARGFDPLLCRQIETIAPGLVSNSLELEGIETGIVDLLPYAQEQHGVLILEPLLDQGASALEALHHVGQRDVVLLVPGRNRDLGALHGDAAVLHGNRFQWCRETPVFRQVLFG